jgi:hypothetical protein
VYESVYEKNRMRTCDLCSESKEDICFQLFRFSKKGIPYYARMCRVCNNDKVKHVARLRKEHIDIPPACQCCGRVGKLHLDHCWETGSFRGFLCRQCNTAIGSLSSGDDKQGLLRALDYLDRCRLAEGHT